MHLTKLAVCVILTVIPVASSTMAADFFSDSELELFLGLTEGTLDDVSLNQTTTGGDATGGSALRTTFSVETGDILEVSYNFLTQEEPDGFIEEGGSEGEEPLPPGEEVNPFNDFAFLSITADGILEVLAEVNGSVLFENSNTTILDSEGFSFLLETGVLVYEYTFEAPGEISLGMGVVDVEDEVVDSALLIDQILLNASPLPGGFDGGDLSAFETLGDVQIVNTADGSELSEPPTLLAAAVAGSYQIFVSNAGETVPEPNSLTLFLLATVGCWVSRRHR